MTDQASLYDQFSGDGAPIYETSKAPFAGTPHANRDDLSKPYESNKEFQSKVDSAPVDSAPKTSASIEWWRNFTGQMTDNNIALKINSMFKRALITDYDAEKARYVLEYNKLLNNQPDRT